MTNEQRKALLTAIQDHYSVRSYPRAEFVHVQWQGLSLKIDYCLKHGTGSGRIVGVVSTKNDEMPESIAVIDAILVQLLEDYQSEMSGICNDINKLLDEIRGD